MELIRPDQLIVRTPDDVVAKLVGEGFVQNKDLKEAYEEDGVRYNLSHNGPYTIFAVLTKGLFVLVFEQNTASQVIDGMTVSIQHPMVCIVSKGDTRVTCNALDLNLILSLVQDMS